MRIGIVGTGDLGSQMTLNLLRAGHEVTVWNRSPEPVDRLIEAGARRAALPEGAFQGDLALSVLFDDAAIRTVLMDSGALERASRICIHACMSTVSVGLAHELQALHTHLGTPYVATTVLGRPEVVERRGLHLLTGGDADLLDAIEGPLSALGTTWRIGPAPVQAQMAKVAANFMLSGLTEAMREAAVMLRRQDTDVEHFLTVMGETLPEIYQTYVPRISHPDPAAPTFMKMRLKDNGAFLDAAGDRATELFLAQAIRSNLQRLAGARGQDPGD